MSDAVWVASTSGAYRPSFESLDDETALLAVTYRYDIGGGVSTERDAVVLMIFRDCSSAHASSMTKRPRSRRIERRTNLTTSPSRDRRGSLRLDEFDVVANEVPIAAQRREARLTFGSVLGA
jgi:hypothetical protein